MVRERTYLDEKELKRRQRERVIILITIGVIILITLLWVYLSRVEITFPISSNIIIFGLININIILILLLIFLIIRNVVKLIFERRHGVIGSKLRAKLVAAFVGLSLIPTFVLFLISINFLSFSIEYWFNLTIGEALDKTVEIAQAYYQKEIDEAKFHAAQISADISRNRLYDENRSEYLNALVEQKRKNHRFNLLGVHLNNQTRKIVLKDPETPDISPIPLSPKVIEDLYAGRILAEVHPEENGDVISGIAPIFSYINPAEVVGFVEVGLFVPKELVSKIGIVSRTSDQYRQLSLLKNPIKLSYIVTLFIVTLLIIFSATWFGLYLAKGITVPIQDLAEATKKVARGDLDHQINVVADDEIGILVESFNKMTRDLKKSKEEIELANSDLEQRRKYMETVLGNVSAGVIAVDGKDVITVINKAAEKMLEIKKEKVLNKRYQDVLPSEYKSIAEEFLKELRENKKGFIEKQMDLMLMGKVLTILMTVTLLNDDEGNYMGMVIVFEDLSQIRRAERIAAWREVARRMAHEIKNPLTPVQLSAQRLQKKYGDRFGEEDTVFWECTRTIIDQVEILKNLVNTFSRYAKLPETNPAPHDLNKVISESLIMFQDTYKGIRFDLEKDESIPRLNLDADQIKRVMINLLDNAVSAVNEQNGHIVVKTSYDRIHKKARVDVADNGCGVPYSYKAKMFEPYFSTKKGGTGLGLAIVSSIIADHHGHVIVRDNNPHGTIVSFELPVPEGDYQEN